MRTTYRVLAWILAAEVVVQAAAIAYALFGLSAWIQGGGTLDQASMESDVWFDGVAGFIVHGINGQIVVPLVALVLLVISFFAKLPRGVAYAGALFGMVVLQVLLGMFARGLPALGALHGALALGILVVAILAARLRAGAPVAAREPARVA